MTALVLVAHGSRNPHAERVVLDLTELISSRRPDPPVRASFLDHTAPTPLAAVLELATAGVLDVLLVPLLFAPGFHVREDLPGVIAQARAEVPGLSVRMSPTLADEGADPAGGELLLDLLDRRLAETRIDPGALVLAAAGSSDADARAVVHALATKWGTRRGLPAAAAFASGPEARPETAVDALGRASNVPAARVAVGMLFLADGFLPGRTRNSVAAAGALCAPVLGAAPELAELVLRRYDSSVALSSA